MESMAEEKDEPPKRIIDLEARLRESESILEESELRATKEREANKELEEELLVYKKEAVEQHEKRFQKNIRQVRFFAKDLDLSLFYPFKDVKDGVQLDEDDLAGEEKATGEE